MKLITHGGLTEFYNIYSGIFDIGDLRSDTNHDLSIGNTWEKWFKQNNFKRDKDRAFILTASDC